jgi:hypothetical protein
MDAKTSVGDTSVEVLLPLLLPPPQLVKRRAVESARIAGKLNNVAGIRFTAGWKHDMKLPMKCLNKDLPSP